METKESILLVEDDQALSESLRFTLQKGGYGVFSARTVQDARRLLGEKEIHLVLLDVCLPDQDGFVLCRELRMQSDVPIVFLSAREAEVDVVRGLDLGGDDYITKPFRVNELLSRLRSVLRRRYVGVRGESVTTSGDLRIDRRTGLVRKGETVIDLTPLEFRLLSVLLDARGAAVSRNAIHRALWNADDHYVDDNTLAVHVRRLRTKIEDNPDEPEHLLTVRGVGYAWN